MDNGMYKQWLVRGGYATIMCCSGYIGYRDQTR